MNSIISIEIKKKKTGNFPFAVQESEPGVTKYEISALKKYYQIEGIKEYDYCVFDNLI